MSISKVDESPRDESTNRINDDDSAIRNIEIYTRINNNLPDSTDLGTIKSFDPFEPKEAVNAKPLLSIAVICVLFFVTMIVSGYITAFMIDVPNWVSAIFIASAISFLTTAVIFSINFKRYFDYIQAKMTYLQHNAIRYQRQSIQLEVAALIARDAANAPDMISILQRTTQLIHKRFGYYHAAIFMVEGDYAILKAASGSTPGSQAMLQNDHRLRVGEEGMIGKVSASGLARIALDVSMDRIHYTNPHLPNTRAEAVIPLKVDDKVVAILDVQSMQRGDFDTHDVRILQIMADLLATVINKTQLHDTVRHYAQQLEQRVNERTQELVSERAQLKVILDNMQEGVIYHNGDDALYLNQSFIDLMQVHSVDEWKGLAKVIVPANDQSTQSIIDEMFQDFGRAGHYRGELQLKRLQDEEIFDANVTCTPIDKQNGNIVTVIRDISQEKALQEQKNRFLAYASHELRTPITNLKTRLYLLQKQPHRFNDHFAIINQVVGRMQWLVDDLLSHTRLEQGRIVLKRDQHSVQKLIDDVVTIQSAEASKKDIQIIKYVPDNEIIFSFDWDRLLQVMTNIIANAINYTQSGGHISIYLIHKHRSIRIDVQDTGIGIPDDLKPQLFQPFVRGSNVQMQGTGLGLVISRQIVELHGGSLTFESTEGVGSTFTITLNGHNAQTISN